MTPERYELSDKQAAMLRVIWDRWERGLKASFRELSEAAGLSAKGKPGPVSYYLAPLVEQGFVKTLDMPQGTLEYATRGPQHFYTRGERLMGIDKRTGCVGRLIDETRNWY